MPFVSAGTSLTVRKTGHIYDIVWPYSHHPLPAGNGFLRQRSTSEPTGEQLFSFYCDFVSDTDATVPDNHNQAGSVFRRDPEAGREAARLGRSADVQHDER